MERRHLLVLGTLGLLITLVALTTCREPAHLRAHRLSAAAIRELTPGPEATQTLLTHFGSLVTGDGTYRSLGGRSRTVYQVLIFESELDLGAHSPGIPAAAGLAHFPMTDEATSALPNRESLVAAYADCSADAMVPLLLGAPRDPFLREARAAARPQVWAFIHTHAADLAAGR